MKRSNKSGVRILQTLSLVLLMIPVVYAAMGAGIISNIGYEDVYWERARYLLGQGGATLYDGSSLCSLGYSLILVPICFVFKSSYAAYKAAILLNGMFLCGSYVVSVMTARRLFPKEKESFLSTACFFAAIIPALSTAKSFTGPKMIVLFLVWLSVYCIAGLYESYQSKRIILLAVCLVLIPFFQIGLIGFDLALIVCLAFLVGRRKLDETVLLKLVLTVLIGVAAGNVIERFVLHGFITASELEVVPVSSLEVYLDGLRAGWENGYLTGLFSALVGKIYVLLVNSLLIAGPAALYFIKKRSWKLHEKTDIIFCVFLFQIIFTGLFDYSRSVSVGLTSLSGVEVCVPFLVLVGIIYIKGTANWSKELIVCMLVTCLSAIITAGVYQKNGVGQISNTNNGILLLFQNWGMNATAVVYFAACLTILLAMIFLFCVKVNTKRKADRLLRTVGVGGLFFVCMVMTILVYRHTAVKFSKENIQSTAPIASVLSGLGETEEYYYYANSGLEKELVILQSLVPQYKIQIVKKDRQEQNDFFEMVDKGERNPVIISKTGKNLTERTFPEELSEYRVAYTTGHYAIWAKRGSEAEAQINQNASRRMEELLLHSSVEDDPEDTMSDEELESETQTEEEQASDSLEKESISAEGETEKPIKKEISKTVTFGTKTMLAPGTYHMEIYFGDIGDLAGKSGEIKLSHAGGTLVTKKINESVLNDGNGMVSIEFSNAGIMRNFKAELKGSIIANAAAEHVYYWKTSPAYTVGLNGGSITSDACTAIQELDEARGKKGSVAYIASDAQNIEDLSVRCFEERLPEYEIQIITKDEIESAQADYLIGVTSSHSYYNAMEQYSVIQRGKYYTVLVQNNSDAYKKYLESGKKLLSMKKLLTSDVFTDEEHVDKETDTIELEAGSYAYYMDVVQLTRNILPHGKIGSVQFFDEEEKRILAEYTVEDTDILRDEEGKTYLRVPLVLREKCSNLSCILKTESDIKMECSLRGIELTAEKYQYGQEEPDIGKLCEIVNSVPQADKLFVVQTLDQINEAESGFSYLEEKMPNVEIETITYDKANDTLADTFILTRGLSENYLRLIGKYNIIGQAGQYTLLVRSEGTIAQEADKQGYHALNNGRKVTFESLALAYGDSEEDGTVVKLPKAVYNVTLKLSADGIKADDTVEVYLMCDKSEKEMDSEIEAVLASGYTSQEALRKVKEQKICGKATYKGYHFKDGSEIVVTFKTDKNSVLENLSVDAFSWQGCRTEGKIIWLEII